MSEALPAARSGLWLALVFTVPMMAWLLGQGLLSAPVNGWAKDMLVALMMLQVLSLVLGMTSLLRYPVRRSRFAGIAMLLLVPLPLYAIAWAVGATAAGTVLLMQLCLWALAALLYLLLNGCLMLLQGGEIRALVLLCVQSVILLGCWVYRAQWSSMLGL